LGIKDLEKSHVGHSKFLMPGKFLSIENVFERSDSFSIEYSNDRECSKSILTPAAGRLNLALLEMSANVFSKCEYWLSLPKVSLAFGKAKIGNWPGRLTFGILGYLIDTKQLSSLPDYFIFPKTSFESYRKA
jgi:hypothetical protein